MRDTRPLWERALSKRGTRIQRSKALPKVQFGAASQLDNTQFLNLVRILIGLPPLYRRQR